MDSLVVVSVANVSVLAFLLYVNEACVSYPIPTFVQDFSCRIIAVSYQAYSVVRMR